MKKIILTIASGVLLFACGSAESVKSTDVTTEDSTKTLSEINESVNGNFSVNKEQSVLNWTGSALAKSHNGTVQVSAGNLEVSEGKLSGGTLTFDLASITCLDLKVEEGKEKLEGHLKNADFFNVDSFPTASIVIKSVAGSTISADLTIKDVTKSISFPATIAITENEVSADAALVINRTDFGVVYGSGNFFDLAKDKVISDEIELQVAVKAIK